jgi:SAM-dependent methyltransferase
MSMATDRDEQALIWQTGVWDHMSDVYPREIDSRFVPVVEGTLRRAALAEVVGLDISPAMLAVATERAKTLGRANIRYVEGRAEAIPAPDGVFDAVLASLSLMYVIDRAAAREIARVLRPGGRLVAAVWAGPERCDIARFPQTTGAFAPTPPVPDVGPGHPLSEWRRAPPLPQRNAVPSRTPRLIA